MARILSEATQITSLTSWEEEISIKKKKKKVCLQVQKLLLRDFQAERLRLLLHPPLPPSLSVCLSVWATLTMATKCKPTAGGVNRSYRVERPSGRSIEVSTHAGTDRQRSWSSSSENGESNDLTAVSSLFLSYLVRGLLGTAAAIRSWTRATVASFNSLFHFFRVTFFCFNVPAGQEWKTDVAVIKHELSPALQNLILSV